MRANFNFAYMRAEDPNNDDHVAQIRSSPAGHVIRPDGKRVMFLSEGGDLIVMSWLEGKLFTQMSPEEIWACVTERIGQLDGFEIEPWRPDVEPPETHVVSLNELIEEVKKAPAGRILVSKSTMRIVLEVTENERVTAKFTGPDPKAFSETEYKAFLLNLGHVISIPDVYMRIGVYNSK